MSLEMDAFSRLAVSQLWQMTLVALAVGLLVRMFCRKRPHHLPRAMASGIFWYLKPPGP